MTRFMRFIGGLMGVYDSLGRKRIFLLVLALACFYALSVNNLLEGGDAERYIIFAKSLRRGEGLTLLSHPQNLAETKFWFGYPAVLAAFSVFFGWSFWALKIPSIISFSLGVYVTYILLKRFVSEKKAFALTFLVGVNPIVFQFSHKIMSEPLFYFFSLTAIYFIFRHIEHKDNLNMYALAAAFFLALTYMTKMTGILLPAATIAYLLHKRKFFKAWHLGLIFFLFILPVFARTYVAFGDPLHSEYLQEFAGSRTRERPRYIIEDGKISFYWLVVRVIDTTKGWVLHTIPENIFPPIYATTSPNFSANLFLASMFPTFASFLTSPSMQGLAAIASILVTFIVAAGLVSRLRNKPTVIEYYTIFYLAFFFSWWRPDARLFIPILPFAMLYFFDGMGFLCCRIGKLRPKTCVVFVFLVLAVTYLGIDGVLLVKERQNYYLPQIQNQIEVGVWARDNTPADSVFLLGYSKGFFLASDRKLVDLDSEFIGVTIDKAVERYGVDYVLLEEGDSIIPRDTTHSLTEVYRTKEPVLLVYKIS